MTFVYCLMFFVIAYLIGSLNFSVIFSKYILKNDVRLIGSKNAGFTNMLRNFGKGWGAAVLICDVCKTLLITIIARVTLDNDVVTVCTGMGVIIGHDYPLYYKFKGGKGVLATISAMVVIDPIIGFSIVGIILLIIFTTGYVSLGSLTGYACFFIAMIIFHNDSIAYLVFGAITCALGFYLHRTNIQRLASGTENNFKKKKK